MAAEIPPSDGIGIANLPNQVRPPPLQEKRALELTNGLQRHKIVAKRGTHFTLMVVGACFFAPLGTLQLACGP